MACVIPQRFRNAVNLLERLSPGHAHPSLIVNLYPDEQGYSLILFPKKGTMGRERERERERKRKREFNLLITITGSESEEFFLPYEDNEIFSYLDNQEVRGDVAFALLIIHLHCPSSPSPPPPPPPHTHTHTFLYLT